MFQDPNHNNKALNNAYQHHFHHGQKKFSLRQDRTPLYTWFGIDSHPATPLASIQIYDDYHLSR